MSNVDRVKYVLGYMKSEFTTDEAFSMLRAVEMDDGITGKQVGQALRSVKFVKNLGNGRFKVRGRKTA